jgi:peroxiredoxin
MSDRSHLVNPGLRLPHLALPRIGDSGSQPVRPAGRRAPVLVYMHGAECGGCRSFLAGLDRERAALEEWDGFVLAIVASEPADRASLDDRPFPLLLDSEGRLRAALGIEPPAVLIADQWGEVHLSERAGEPHHFPTVESVVQWVRYLATQCPECQGEAL